MNTPSDFTSDVVAQDQAHFLHPWQVFDVFADEGALPIASGDDCRIWDTDGNEYFDPI